MQSYAEDPTNYPLPLSLSELAMSSPRAYNSYTTMPPLPTHVETAILALWESRWRPLLDLMLIFHIGRDETRNLIQHPPPTRQFAMAYIKTFGGLSDKDRAAASLLICLSNSEKDGISRPTFDLGDEPKADGDSEHASDLYVEMEKIYNKGTMDSDLDSEPLQKKAKHDN